MKTFLTQVLIALSLSSNAFAAGLMLSPDQLEEQDREELLTEIQRAKARYPQVAAEIANLPNLIIELDRSKRGSEPILAPHLSRYAPEEALFPLIELIAFNGADNPDTSAKAALVLRSSILYAIGTPRDPRVEPVLRAILTGNEEREELVRSAAESLAMLETDAVVQTLVEMALTPGPKQFPVQLALSECRRLACARALTVSLERETEPTRATRLVRALGRMGSDWVWQSNLFRARKEKKAIRERVLKSMFAVYLKAPELRPAITKSILMVNDPAATREFMANASNEANPELLADLEQLERKFANNPSNRVSLER